MNERKEGMNERKIEKLTNKWTINELGNERKERMNTE